MYEKQECSNGPVSTLPGARTDLASIYGPAHGVMCEDHSDRPASQRIQGETDSMGCEYHFLCAECAEAARIARLEPKDGYCEWHKGQGSDIRPYRDSDEGMSGPVYSTCKDCRDRNKAALRAELDEMDRDDPYRDYVWDNGRDDDNEDDEECSEHAAPMLSGETHHDSAREIELMAQLKRHRRKKKKPTSERTKREIEAALSQNSDAIFRIRYFGAQGSIPYYEQRQRELREQLNRG